MVRALTDMRIAESQIDIDALAFGARLIDFNLGPREGIEILGVLGTWGIDTPTHTATMVHRQYVQTLHLNDDINNLEDPANQPADTSHGDIDSEIFFEQQRSVTLVEDDVNHTDAVVDGQGNPFMWVPPMPLLTARSISHRGQGFDVNGDCPGRVKIYYRYVEFSKEEQLLLFARRR